MSEVNSHMQKYAITIVTFGIRCHVVATKGNSRTMRSQIKRDSADEGVVMSELQAHHFITPEQ